MFGREIDDQEMSLEEYIIVGVTLVGIIAIYGFVCKDKNTPENVDTITDDSTDENAEKNTDTYADSSGNVLVIQYV